MKANYLPIQSVFDKHTVFEIPYYQRSYVWDEDNWSRFLEDMEYVTKTNKTHFFGSIILKDATIDHYDHILQSTEPA